MKSQVQRLARHGTVTQEQQEFKNELNTILRVETTDKKLTHFGEWQRIVTKGFAAHHGAGAKASG